MRPIKITSGDVLLYFYTFQRKKGFGPLEVLSFYDWDNIQINKETNLAKDLLKICDENVPNLYNSLEYLKGHHFISYDRNRSTGGDSLMNFTVTFNGIDIIEGIERGEQERNNFYVTFNIKIENNINVESLIKNEVGSVLSLSAFKLH